MIMPYSMFTILATGHNARAKQQSNNSRTSEAADDDLYVESARYVVNPGPDIVVADEADTIRNKHSNVANLMKSIRTKRRIALTGSPLQNNLREYLMNYLLKNQ